MTAKALRLFALTVATAPCLFAQTTLPLVPMPREVVSAGSVPLDQGIELVCQTTCSASDTFAINDLKSTLAERGIAVNAGAPVHIFVARYGSPLSRSIYQESATRSKDNTGFPAYMQAEGYSLVPDHNGIALTAESDSGIFYALQTVKQLIQGYGTKAVLQMATIRDWPAMKTRGLSDDLSRGPVPTLEFQKKQIRTLAAYKVNLYSPYFEHTMQYTADPLMAPPGGSISAEDARELVAYAAQYHITIAPEQEAFGHLHFLLNWEQYAPLSETPHGQVLATGHPESLDLTKRMFTELAQIYPGPYLHVGADETFELGKGQTKADVDARGLNAVYLEEMTKIVSTLQPLHRKLLFWGDIAMHDPKLVKDLPQSFKDSVIAIAWEYNPQPKGFAKWITPFTAAKMECWVAPGINNWRRVYPNYNFGLDNMQHFTAEGQADGCTGQLNTVWHDDGETLANNDWYGILFGAAAAWQPGLSNIDTFQNAYGSVFHGDATGKINQAQRELMAVHQLMNDNFKHSDATDLLFWLDPWSVDGQRYLTDLRPILPQIRQHAERAIVLTREARMSQTLRETDALDALELGARRMDLLAFKFQVSDEIATYYADAYAKQNVKVITGNSVGASLGAINGVNGKLQDMRDGYSLIHDMYQEAWLKSYRPYWLYNNLAHYDMTVQLWLQRIDQLRAVQRQWSNTHTIPPASQLGIPPAPPITTDPTAAPAPTTSQGTSH